MCPASRLLRYLRSGNLKKKTRNNVLETAIDLIEELGPMTANTLNATLLKSGLVSKSMYTSPCALGCWFKGDSRFKVVGQDKKRKNIWGLSDETKQVKN